MCEVLPDDVLLTIFHQNQTFPKLVSPLETSCIYHMNYHSRHSSTGMTYQRTHRLKTLRVESEHAFTQRTVYNTTYIVRVILCVCYMKACLFFGMAYIL